jgi:hypothetical protein
LALKEGLYLLILVVFKRLQTVVSVNKWVKTDSSFWGLPFLHQLNRLALQSHKHFQTQKKNCYERA